MYFKSHLISPHPFGISQCRPPSLKLKRLILVSGLALGCAAAESAWAGCVLIVNDPTHSTSKCSTTGATFDVGGPPATAGPAALAQCQDVCSGSTTEENTSHGLPPLPPKMMLSLYIKGDDRENGCVEIGTTHNIDFNTETLAGTFSGTQKYCGSLTTDAAEPVAKIEIDTADWVRLAPTGSKFMGWSGNAYCQTFGPTSDGKVIAYMVSSLSCYASFVKSSYTLNISTQGQGRVSSSDGKMNCGSDATCTQSFERGVNTTLSAIPDAGWQFAGWEADCLLSGQTPSSVVNMFKETACTANFSQIPLPEFLLTVTKTGTGASEGLVTSEDNKITCGTTCSDNYEQNSSVILNAKGNDKSKFKEWAQCSNSLEPQITVTVDAAKTCEASFETITTTPPPVVVTPTDKKPQTITILSFTAEVGKTTALKVTGGGSQNPVKLVGQTTSICTVTDNNVTFTQEGECKIEATQSGNEEYDDAPPVAVTITVTPAMTKPTDTTKQDQVITAVSLTSVTGSGNLTAQGGGSNNPIIFASQSEDVCTVNTNTATFLKTGTCILTADQAGNSQYNPAPQLTVTLGVQTATTPAYTSCAVLADAPVVNDTCDGKGKIASKTHEFGSNADVSNIVIDHPVTNQGLLSNLSITKEGKIDRGDSKKGTLGGEIHNEGTLCNFVLTGHLLEGGTLCGNVRVEDLSNMIKNVTLAENTTLSGGSVSGKIVCQSPDTSILENVLIQADTELVGCKLGEGTFELPPMGQNDYGVFTQTKGKGGGVIRSNPLGKNDKGIEVIELIAVPDDNSGFTRWENDKAPECTGRKETVQVLVNDIKTCMAYFYVKSNTSADWANSPLTGENGTLKIHMEGSGGGYVKSTPIEENSQGVNKVKLTATADSNSVLGEWEGENAPECVGTKTEVEVVIEGEKTCTAYFDAVSPEDKQKQEISIEVTPSRAIVGGQLKVKTSGGNSTNPVTLKANSPEVCSLEGDTVTLLKEGTCSVTADQVGNGQYLDAEPQTVTIAVRNDKASIIGKVSSDKDSSGQVQTATTLDTLNVSLDLKAAPNDVGQDAEILLVAELNGQWFKATESGWLAWDKNMANLGALTQVRLSAETISLPIYQGTLPLAGTVNLFAAYRLKNKTLTLEQLQKVLSLNITAPPTVETAKATCAQQGGIYFSQQCFTKVPTLAEQGHFTGGVYQFDQPQAGLQTVVDLPCRLGQRIAILGSFQNEYPPGNPAEIVVAFVHGLSAKMYQYNDQGFSELPYIGSADVPDLNRLSGIPVASMPATYSGVFFEGELPSKGQLYAFFGYRLKNPDGSTQMIHYSQTPLAINVAAESCIRSDLELEILPLGTGMGNVFSNELGSEKIVLSALPADDSVLTGWQGNAEGCTPHPTATVTIKPSADKYACQPVFERKTPLNCDESDPTCSVIPEPCTPPPQTSRWIHGIRDDVTVKFVNRSSNAKDVVVNLFESSGTKVGSGNNALDLIQPFQSISFDATALKDIIGAWTGDASMEVLDAKNLTVISYFKGAIDSIATSQHRLYGVSSHHQIRISNTSDSAVPLSARVFDKDGNMYGPFDILENPLSPHASVMVYPEAMKVPNLEELPDSMVMEIYPKDADKRCSGQIQLVLRNGYSQTNVTPTDD